MRRLRRDGKCPAVVYGHGEETVSITLEAHELLVALGHGERLWELDLEGKTQNVLLKDVQYDYLGDDVLHVDLVRVDLDERVEVTVPIRFVGTPAGVKEGGVLQQSIAQIILEVPAGMIPDEVKIVATEMQLDERMLLGQIELPEGAKLLDDPNTLLCVVAEIAEEVPSEEVEGEESAQPEVIGEKIEEESSEDADA